MNTSSLRPTLKEVYGKAVRVMANRKAPMMKGGPASVTQEVKGKMSPPPQAGKPFMCPQCNQRNASGGYCPNCGSKMVRAVRKGPVPPIATRY